MFVEPGRFQDVIARGKPSFLPGINKAAYGSALSARRGWSHSPQANQLSPGEPPPSPARPAAPRGEGEGEAELGRGVLGP